MRSGALLLVILLAASCTPRGLDGSAAQRDVLRVSAAASLADAFTEIADAYEATAPDTEVELNLAGSTTLVEQVLRAAPVDVLATADERTMRRAVDAGVAGEPVPFARNQMVVAWPASGPDRRVEDLGDTQLLVGLCAPQVPCGAAAREGLAAAGVRAAPDTEDPDVRTLLARLATGELDVGVVYATDVTAAAGAVESAPLPEADTTLVIAPVRTRAERAQPFIDFVRSPTGVRVLRDHGFEVVS